MGSSKFWGEKEVAGRRGVGERERKRLFSGFKQNRQQKGKRSWARGQNGLRQ